MALDFPTSPALNEIYSYGGRSWQWNGTAWDVYNASGGLTQYVSKLNGLCGSINIAAGTSISVTPTGNTLTIAYTGSGGGGGGGNTGATGATGATGPQGNTGATGTNGTNGNTGATGNTGGTGPQGNTGATGAIPTNYVISFNGLTGAVTGVASIRGLTGAVGITNGTGIGLSVSGQTMTFSNTGVLSINGVTGAITNVARTNVDNNFSAAQTVTGAITSSDSSTDHSIILIPSTDKIRFYDNSFGNSFELYAGGNLNNQVIAFPSSNTTLAGLEVTQTFTGTNTFNAVTNFVSGISAAGGVTFSGTLKGVTANFTGLVSSTVGFSGPGTNITGVVTSFNNQTGAVTGVTVGGTNVFTALNTFNAGISAAGGVTFAGTLKGVTATFSGNVTAQSTLYTDTILAIGNQINIANAASGRVAFGDFDGNGNSTFVFIRDSTSTLYISNPFGSILIGDPNGVDNANYLTYNAPGAYLDGNNSSLTNFSTGSFSGLLTASAGISAAGATFNAPVNLRNTLLINSSQGSNNQVLTSTGSGITWATPSGGGSSVTSFNGLTGAVTGVTLGGAAFTGLVSSTNGFSGPGTNITGLVSSFNGLTGAVLADAVSWSVITADQTAVINKGYFTNKATLLTLTLPSTAAVGSVLRVSGMTAGLWKVAQNASGVIHFGKTDTTVGAGGYIQSTLARDAVELICCVANNEWNVLSSVGNITIV